MAPDTPLAWLFVDMNAFFASVEQHLRPELFGLPIAVIPVESDYTCVIAASHEAKRHGVKTGTSVRDARTMCPAIRFIKARPQEYVRIHHGVAASIDRCAPIHKAYSIDEWAIRLGGPQRDPQAAQALARTIKASIRKDYGPAITCSIGIAPTRLLAKVGSDLKKPDGLTLLQLNDLPDKIEHLALQDLCGIGRSMAARLAARGVHTVRDLWNLTRAESIAAWGSSVGADWWSGLHGRDEPEVPSRHRSMSHSNVLDPKFRSEEGARGILIRLVCRLGTRLRADGYVATALNMFVNDINDHVYSSSIGLPEIQDTPTLLAAFYRLWSQRPPSRTRPIKVGVSVTGLAPAGQVSAKLFESAQRPCRLSRAMDAINTKWGTSSIYVGSMHVFRQHMDDKIAFGRIPPIIPA